MSESVPTQNVETEPLPSPEAHAEEAPALEDRMTEFPRPVLREPEYRVRVHENGRIVLPKLLRQALGISPGDVVLFAKDELGVRLETQKQRIRQAQEMVRKYIDPSRSLVDELIAERRPGTRRIDCHAAAREQETNLDRPLTRRPGGRGSPRGR